jgi:hypothetical protein
MIRVASVNRIRRWSSNPILAKTGGDVAQKCKKIFVSGLGRAARVQFMRRQPSNLVLHQRLETIDALRGRIEQLQERNRQLDEEAERYALMIAAAPATKLYSE